MSDPNPSPDRVRCTCGRDGGFNSHLKHADHCEIAIFHRKPVHFFGNNSPAKTEDNTVLSEKQKEDAEYGRFRVQTTGGTVEFIATYTDATRIESVSPNEGNAQLTINSLTQSLLETERKLKVSEAALFEALDKLADTQRILSIMERALEIRRSMPYPFFRIGRLVFGWRAK